ncbi:MAG: hypothetical protein Q7J85_08230 [Bacillota bacterium]|nr:hypothetical protein [Bacillota bacterium]
MSVLENRGKELIFRGIIHTPPEPSLLWYYFSVIKEGRTFFYGSNPQHAGGKGVVTESNPVPYQITVFKERLFLPLRGIKKQLSIRFL